MSHRDIAGFLGWGRDMSGTVVGTAGIPSGTDMGRQYVPLDQAMEIEGVGRSTVYRRVESGQYDKLRDNGRILFGIPLRDDDGTDGTSHGTLSSHDGIPQRDARDGGGISHGTSGTNGTSDEKVHVPAIPLERVLMGQVQDLRGERDRLLSLLESHVTTIQVQEQRIFALTDARDDPASGPAISRRWWQFWRPRPSFRVAH